MLDERRGLLGPGPAALEPPVPRARSCLRLHPAGPSRLAWTSRSPSTSSARCSQQCRRWQEQGSGLPIAVNLSTRNLPTWSFPSRSQACSSNGVDHDLLEFEITESTMLADLVRTKLIRPRNSMAADLGDGHFELV